MRAQIFAAARRLPVPSPILFILHVLALFTLVERLKAAEAACSDYMSSEDCRSAVACKWKGEECIDDVDGPGAPTPMPVTAPPTPPQPFNWRPRRSPCRGRRPRRHKRRRRRRRRRGHRGRRGWRRCRIRSATPSRPRRLGPNARLYPGEFLRPPADDRYRFGLADDADLSLWDGTTKVWSALTCCEGAGAFLAMQGDGNAVVYSYSGANERMVLWASNTDGNDGAYMTLRNDGVPRIIAADGADVLWEPNHCEYLVRPAHPPPGPSPPGLVPVNATTLLNKVMAGYQGWFGTTCEGDATRGGPNSWRHWAAGSTPGPGNYQADMWPDLSEYGDDELCGTDFVYAGGSSAGLFSSWTRKTVERHVRWMYDYGIDGVFVQRFISETKTLRCLRDRVLETVRRGSEQYGRVFANMYDISGANTETMYQDVKMDWMHLVDVERVTDSDRYLRHNGRPLLAIWGFGFDDRVGDPASVAALIDWFQCSAEEKYRATVMGGVPSRWRTLTGDSKPDLAWAAVYRSFDVLSPWTVGRFKNDVEADAFRTDFIEPDRIECQQQIPPVDYLPVVFPGFSFSNTNPAKPFNEIPRNGGRFFWRQIYNAFEAGNTQLYVAMFDEVDEATAIFKVAETAGQTPTDGNFVTLDQDIAPSSNEIVPSDWFLRLTGDATQMIRVDGLVPENMPALPSTERRIRRRRSSSMIGSDINSP